jgi:hypothetical protein
LYHRLEFLIFGKDGVDDPLLCMPLSIKRAWE